MKIGIIGIGVVGNAIFQSMKNRSLENLEIIGYDKYKKIGDFEDMLKTDIVFLCLPTPFDLNKKSYDQTAIDEICKKLFSKSFQGLVVIKSTVEPETCETLAGKYHLKICHNPEFLTARTAYQDFEDQYHIVIGISSNTKSDDTNIISLVNMYQIYYPAAEISICSSNESELMKLAVNNFYAVKVQFFNELYLLADKIENTSYDRIRDMMLKNKFINHMHTEVPGPDGKLSYGGMCFPKDTNSLLQYMIKKTSPHNILAATIKERNEMRKEI